VLQVVSIDQEGLREGMTEFIEKRIVACATSSLY
jgi:hypothetical protein